jgi:hypothetical protein
MSFLWFRSVPFDSIWFDSGESHGCRKEIPWIGIELKVDGNMKEMEVEMEMEMEMEMVKIATATATVIPSNSIISAQANSTVYKQTV